MNRKKFLMTTVLAAFSVSSFGNITKLNDKFVSDCETTNDILGPFYKPNAPLRQDLTFNGLEGSIITLKGIVYKSDCITPLKNALVEIWQANANGEYDNESNNFYQRARWFTNENGEYEFKTILPGKYLNGNQYRPAHIHFRISEKESKELISQIYFKGDPHITNDPWASKPKAELRILPIVLEDTKGNLTVNFDVYLSDK
jgi:protocatechuate 3,4-dioxygenase beta subunit